MGRNNADFHGVTFKYERHPLGHYLEAQLGETPVGGMDWSHGTGEVQQITVAQEHRRKGVATALWNEANRMADEGTVTRPKHGKKRTKEGDLWTKAVSPDAPEAEKIYGT